MFKLAFLAFAVGSILCMVRYNNRPGRYTYRRITRSVQSSISAEPNKLQEAMEKLPLAMQGVTKQLGGSMGQIAEMGKKLLGKFSRGQRERSKRSAETSYVITSADKSNYQKVEVKNKDDNDNSLHQNQEAVVCLVKENEVYWLEMVTSALIYVTQEMKKVLNGKVIKQQMPKDMYNRTKSAH